MTLDGLIHRLQAFRDQHGGGAPVRVRNRYGELVVPELLDEYIDGCDIDALDRPSDLLGKTVVVIQP